MKNMEKLIEIVAKLRSPEGCPWDREQTHQSLKPYIIEEAYEVLEAIDSGDDSKFSEELGDLLLQIILHSQVASERGAFKIDDVADKISRKLVERHPHVFASKTDLTSEEVLHNWEKINLEKAENKDYSVLQGVPSSLPALLKAYRVQQKVGRYGFDWQNPYDVIVKVKEEIAEFEEALKTGEKSKQEHELGDLLFSLVNLGRHLEMQPEEALNAAIRRFTRRFQHIENRLREQSRTLSDSNLEEMDKYWNEAKSLERQ
jgi:tetrapyrrole methylase family protein/MazG family protein